MILKRPTLLVDRQKCLRNIRLMAEKALRHNVEFRPHFKTHQSAEIGNWFKNFGVKKITVSSVTMAEYFADNGWDDITIAFPVNPAEVDEINQLAENISLNLLVENPAGINVLAENIRHNVGIFIKIDAGYHRTGIDVSDHAQVLSLIKLTKTNKHLTFKGLVVHNGHTYNQPDPTSILAIHDQSLKKIAELKSFLNQNNVFPVVSIGDTPALSLTENLTEVDEIRPGNFVFYDLMQQKTGACQYEDVAVALACPVVAVHPNRLEVVIYGGAIHLSKEFITDDNGNQIFGRIVWLDDSGRSAPLAGTYIKSLSQEHGIIKTTTKEIDHFHPGKFIGILPVHSCLTTNLMTNIFTTDGEKLGTIRKFEIQE